MGMISVILPVYKSEKYLAATLDSVLAQTYADFEVLCVDDCSPDQSAQIIKEYAAKDSRIHYLSHTQNMGSPAYGRNSGIAAAKGEYITFLDHDDSFLPTKFEVLLSAMETEKVDFISSNCFLVNGKTGNQDMSAWGTITGDPKKGFAKRLLAGNFVPPNSTLIRRSVLDVVGNFDTTLKGVDDYDLWYRIARQFPSTIFPKPLATWRYLNEASISANQALMLQDELVFYEKILNLPDAAEWEKELAQIGIQRDRKRLANLALLNGNYSQAKKMYAEAGLSSLRTATSLAGVIMRWLYQKRLQKNAQFKPLDLEF